MPNNSYDNFRPQNEDERIWVEQYNNVSKFISEKIRGLSEEHRLPVLRDLNKSDTSLKNLYLQALKAEDYETCSVAKVLLEERGITFKD